MIRTHQYKLYSNNSYRRKFTRWIGVSRLVYNLAKETKEYAYKQYEASLSKYDLMNQLPELKKEFKWIAEVNAQTLQAVIERLDNSFQKFFNGAGYPKWAKKHKYRSFKFKQGVKRTKKGFKLPKFGEVKVFNNERTFTGTIKGAIMIKKADGLYLYVIVKSEDSEVSEKQTAIGIDMGISYFCVTSDGQRIDNPKHLNKYLKKLRIANRTLARKKKGSANWIKQVQKLKQLHKKVTDTRRDFLHKVSSSFAEEYDKVVVEDLNIAGMSKNTKLSQHILDCGWGTFFGMLNYKTDVKKVDPKYTSQTCSKCGCVDSMNRTTQSNFTCIECGYRDNADVNAAKIIKRRGHSPSPANVAAARASVGEESPKF